MLYMISTIVTTVSLVSCIDHLMQGCGTTLCILRKGPYLPRLSMVGRALWAEYHHYVIRCTEGLALACKHHHIILIYMTFTTYGNLWPCRCFITSQYQAINRQITQLDMPFKSVLSYISFQISHFRWYHSVQNTKPSSRGVMEIIRLK